MKRIPGSRLAGGSLVANSPPACKTKEMIRTVLGIGIILLVLAGAWSAACAVSLTSITLDPEDATGTTTNAPGAWSTNTADPLVQIGVMSGGGFVNHEEYYGQPVPGYLGEISIALTPGINVLTLFGNGTFPYTAFYGAVLFFDAVASPPQIAVYNANGALVPFGVQPADTTIIGSANGGLFFDKAPGTSVYVAADGTRVEVLSFVINSLSSNTDEMSAVTAGPDGTPDTTAQLILGVTLPLPTATPLPTVTPTPTPVPAEATQNLINTINALPLPAGTANSLTSKLAAAVSQIESGNSAPACNQLKAFLNEVAAQQHAGRLSAAQAANLTAAADTIRVQLGC